MEDQSGGRSASAQSAADQYIRRPNAPRNLRGRAGAVLALFAKRRDGTDWQVHRVVSHRDDSCSCSRRLRADASRGQSRKDESRSQHGQHHDLLRDACACHASSDACETDHEQVRTYACSAQAESGEPISSIQKVQDSAKGDSHSRTKEPDLSDGARRELERRGHVEYAQGQNRGGK